MVYQGSKAKLVEWLLSILSSYIEKASFYYEPFCGGANFICEVSHGRRFASDVNPYLIALLKKVQEDPGAIPEFIDRETYYRVKRNKAAYEKWYVGLVAFCATYRGLFWGGHVGDDALQRSTQLLSNLRAQAFKLGGIDFFCADFRRVKVENFPKGGLFYLDPPYRGVSGYKYYFDHNAFYRWCGKVHSLGHEVFLSEFWAPSVFEEVSAQDRHDCLAPQEPGDEAPIVTEKIFRYVG
jgi:DNA adenine methylase